MAVEAIVGAISMIAAFTAAAYVLVSVAGRLRTVACTLKEIASLMGDVDRKIVYVTEIEQQRDEARRGWMAWEVCATDGLAHPRDAARERWGDEVAERLYPTGKE